MNANKNVVLFDFCKKKILIAKGDVIIFALPTVLEQIAPTLDLRDFL